jgi:hypothetical protein
VQTLWRIDVGYLLNPSLEYMEWNNGMIGGKLIANGTVGSGRH